MLDSNWLNMANYGAPADPNMQIGPANYNFNPAPAQGGWFDGFLSKHNPMTNTTEQGWGMPALGAAQGIFNAYMGLKQYGLYKDQLAESKRQFGLNYDAQRQTTNAALEDRQIARVASNPTAYQSVGDYMAQNSIRKG